MTATGSKRNEYSLNNTSVRDDNEAESHSGDVVEIVEIRMTDRVDSFAV